MNDPGLVRRSGWELVYDGFFPEIEGRREALCTLGNGYMATRGAAPEAIDDDTHYPATYVAGCYNRLTSELAGERIDHESLVNVPNWLPLSFRIDDGPWFAPGVGDVIRRQQVLDLYRGVLRRSLRVRDEEGRETAIEERRLVSMACPNLAAIRWIVTPVDWSGRIEVRSSLDGRVANTNVVEDRLLANRHLQAVDVGWSDDGADWLEVETSWSHIRVASASRTTLDGREPVTVSFEVNSEPELVTRVLGCRAEEGQAMTVEKIVAVHTSRDVGVGRPLESALQDLAGAPGFVKLEEQHALAWAHLWQRCEIDLDDGGADETTVSAVRLHAFHILQTASPHIPELDVGIAARGLHGEGYRGHIFWDELFVFPFLNLRFPDLTRALLKYRSRRLPAARRQAAELGQQGARFPWQSGSDGSEQTPTQLWNPRSGRWMPDNSHRQHHVGLAVAWNVWQYHLATGDYRFMLERGIELVVELARFWAGLATWEEADQRHHILGVMGPDEYHDGYPDRIGNGVDDNAYTNVLVSWLLRRTLEIRARFDAHQLEAQLWERLGVTTEELDRWAKVATSLHIPFHDGIISQFAGWGDLLEFDWPAYRETYGNIGRLDLILEAEGDTTNRYKLAKQADVLMLLYLMSPDELSAQLKHMGYHLSPEAVTKTVEYYLRRTAHGSTLSRIVYAWVTARVDREHSWELFREALAADIDDTQGGTTPEGIHLGAMAGSLDLLQRCYSGLELRGNAIWFDPVLPPSAKRLTFDVIHRNRSLNVELTHDRLRVEVERGAVNPVPIGVHGQVLEIGPGQALEVDLTEGSSLPRIR